MGSTSLLNSGPDRWASFFMLEGESTALIQNRLRLRFAGHSNQATMIYAAWCKQFFGAESEMG